MKANPSRFWIVTILLGWIFDFLFWNKPLGVNFAIFVGLCLLTGILFLRADGLRLARGSGLLLLPIAFFAAITFIRLEPLTVFLAVVMVLFLMGLFALTYLSGEWSRYSMVDYFWGYLRLAGSMIARPLGFASENRREQPVEGAKRGSQVWPILRGLVIALPVVAIFAALLSSADPIFASRFEDFIDVFKIENLPQYIFRLVLILVVAYVLAGTFLHAAQKSDEKVEEKTLFSPFLGFTESTIVLGSVVLLFVAFVIVQFQYFFGGQANISLEGFTYSEYARKGFGELVTVAFFSLLLLLGLGAMTRRATESQRRTFSSLGVILVGLVIVMLVAAFQRLVLYEMAYGFSRLRTYTHVFMIWLGLLLVVVVILEILRRERAVALAMVLASLGFAVSLSLLNVDAFIVQQNVQREIRGTGEKVSGSRTGLDTQYFMDLSEDSIPPLVEAFHSKSLPVPVKEKVGAALACKLYEDRQKYKEDSKKYSPWQSFHFSRLNADVAFNQVSKELKAYKMTTQIWPLKVETPGGEEFSCYQDYFMD
ncbi:MAG TPA: DUF4173 domain-containing protein [Anaerolineales bacterium]|nr:DUF4173 domain-containing protein [Anaerolineales bacterium]